MRCRRRENCLALQTGETLELLSSNRLAATPHFVNSTASPLGRAALETIERHKAQDESWRAVERGTVSRETLAVFLQVGAILESSLAQQMYPTIAHAVLSACSLTIMKSFRARERHSALSLRELTSDIIEYRTLQWDSQT